MLEQAEADSCLPGAGHVPCPLCGNGTVWQSQGSLECSRRASMLRVCRLGRATARHPCVLGLTWLALGGAPRSGGAAVPLRVQREAECRAPASAEVADSETPLDTPRRASHACPLQLLTSPDPSPNPNPNQVRLARVPSPAAHRRPPRAAAAAPREDGHLATAARELGLPRRGAVRAAWPKCPGPLQPAAATHRSRRPPALLGASLWAREERQPRVAAEERLWRRSGTCVHVADPTASGHAGVGCPSLARAEGYCCSVVERAA